MSKASALNFLIVTRSFGYALATIMALFVAVFFALAALSGPGVGVQLTVAFVPALLAGLALAWASSLARVFVQKSRFSTDTATGHA